jgi:hypothetical protein
MKIKISATFEGKCDICGNNAMIFTAGDEDTKKVVSICKDCSDKLGEMKTSDVVEKYGKVDEKSFDQGVKVQNKLQAG